MRLRPRTRKIQNNEMKDRKGEEEEAGTEHMGRRQKTHHLERTRHLLLNLHVGVRRDGIAGGSGGGRVRPERARAWARMRWGWMERQGRREPR